MIFGGSDRLRHVVVLPMVLIALMHTARVADASGNDNCTPVSYLKTTLPFYPIDDLLHHVTGTPIIRVTVTPDGTPANLLVATSSGHDSLDRAALTAVQQYRFNPKMCSGKAVVSPVLVPVAFNRKDFGPESIKFEVDETPIEFNSIGQELAYLRHRRDTESKIGDEGEVFFDTKQSLIWIVRRAPDGKNGEVVRVKAEERGSNLYEVYSVECDQSKAWCGNQLEWCLDFVQSNPLLPTPQPSQPEH
jgi:TonB family protein